MALTKRPGSSVWQIDITFNGKRIKRSTGTKDRALAQRVHDQFKADLWRQKHLGIEKTRNVAEVVLEYVKTVEDQRDYGSKIRHLIYWNDAIGNEPIDAVTTDVLERFVPKTTVTPSGVRKPLSGASQNRYLSAISAVLRFAVKRDWLAKSPYIPKRAEAPIRESYATKEQVEILLDNLNGWMRDISEFAYFTGMRASEILTLEWRYVNLRQGAVNLPGSKAKSGHGRVIPLADRALDVLNRRKGLHDKYVFLRKKPDEDPPLKKKTKKDEDKEEDRPAQQIDARAFARAVHAAGLPPGFRFHDLRHSWASRMAAAGVPLLVLQKLGGWKTLSMLNRYAHFATEDLSKHVNKIDDDD